MQHHDLTALRAAVTGVPPRRWTGQVHHHGPPDRPLVATLSTAPRAARYHEVGDPASWYASLDEQALPAELMRHLPAEVELEHVLRRVGRAQVDARVLDLRDVGVQRALTVDDDMLTDDDQSVCRVIATVARSIGHQGLLAPSAALSGGTTLVVFREHLHCVVEIESSVVPAARLLG